MQQSFESTKLVINVNGTFKSAQWMYWPMSCQCSVSWILSELLVVMKISWRMLDGRRASSAFLVQGAASPRFLQGSSGEAVVPAMILSASAEIISEGKKNRRLYP